MAIPLALLLSPRVLPNTGEAGGASCPLPRSALPPTGKPTNETRRGVAHVSECVGVIVHAVAVEVDFRQLPQPRPPPA
jgi:hypothetical protein